MHTFQLEVLANELKDPRYHSMTAQQAYGHLLLERYRRVRQTVFLTSQEARRQRGRLPQPHIVLSDSDAAQFPEAIPAMPERLEWTTFLTAWQMARGGR